MIIKKAQIKESGKYLTLAKRYTGYYPVLTISIDNRTPIIKNFDIDKEEKAIEYFNKILNSWS